MNTVSILHMIDIKITFLWCDKKQYQNFFITTIHTFFENRWCNISNAFLMTSNGSAEAGVITDNVQYFLS